MSSKKTITTPNTAAPKAVTLAKKAEIAKAALIAKKDETTPVVLPNPAAPKAASLTKKAEATPTAQTTNPTHAATRPEIVDKTYEARAYVIAYRSPKERAAALAARFPERKIPESESKKGEAQVVLEGHLEWVPLGFGGVYPGSRLHVKYVKDAEGKIFRRSIAAIKD